MSEHTLNIVLSVIGAITGISGLIISLLEHRRTRFLAVHEYLSAVESKEFIEAKKYVYNNDSFSIKNEEAAMVVNYLNHWGILAKRNYLPLWAFDGSTGTGLCRLFEKLCPYIENRRTSLEDPSYGEHFDWLYKKIKNKHNRNRR